MRRSHLFGWTAACTVVLVAVLPASASAQTDGGTLTVSPTATTAGSDLSVSGKCPSGWTAGVHGYTTARDRDFFEEHVYPPTQPDGSYAGTFRIPREAATDTWTLSISCSASDMVLPGEEKSVRVTGTAPVPVTIDAMPRPAVPGGKLTISGSGCEADGRPLGRAVGSLFHSFGSTAASAYAETKPGAGGAWSVTVTVPKDFPEGDADLSVQCDDTGSTAQSFGRYLTVRFPVGTASATATTAPPAAPRHLARTGAKPISVALVALTLLGFGVFLRALAEYRRRARATSWESLG